MDEVGEDLRKLGIKEWLIVANNRKSRRKILRESEARMELLMLKDDGDDDYDKYVYLFVES